MTALFGTGPAKALEIDDFAIAADGIKAHPAHVEAIAIAESGGFGWFRDGRMKILPEPHKFHEYLPAAKRAKARQMGIATRSYKETRASGHYRRMGSPNARYAFFQRMIDHDREAAFMAVSYGTYQIMGFNHAICGYVTAEAMFRDFLTGEKAQLDALMTFLGARRLISAIRNGDWMAVERGYNGGGQGGAYARKMAKYAADLKAGKWAGYTPGKRRARVAEKAAGKAVERVSPPQATNTAAAPQTAPAPRSGGVARILKRILLAALLLGLLWVAFGNLGGQP